MRVFPMALFVPLLISGCFRSVVVRDRSGAPVPDALVISTRMMASYSPPACYASLSDANGKAVVQEHCDVYVLKKGYLPVEGSWGIGEFILDEAPDAISAYEIHEHDLWYPASDTYSKIDSPLPGLVVEARVSDRRSHKNIQAPLDHDLPKGSVEIEYRVSSPKGDLYRCARFYGKLADSEILGPMSSLEMKGNTAFVFSGNGKHYKMFLTDGNPSASSGSHSFSMLLFAEIHSARTPVFPKNLIPPRLEFTTDDEYYKGPLDPEVAMDRYNSAIASLKDLQKVVSPSEGTR